MLQTRVIEENVRLVIDADPLEGLTVVYASVQRSSTEWELISDLVECKSAGQVRSAIRKCMYEVTEWLLEYHYEVC